jgi:hypothetical protein
VRQGGNGPKGAGVSTENFDELARGLATTTTRRRALGVMAGGIAGFWGLARTPWARANQACQHSAQCRTHGACCCVMPHGHNPGVCMTPDGCHRVGGFCMGVKKG